MFEDISYYSDFLIYGNFLKIDRDFKYLSFAYNFVEFEWVSPP